MAIGSQYETDSDQPYPPRRKGPWTTCLIGCLITVVVLSLLAAVAAFWISRNWRGWAATAASQAIKQSIEAGELPDDEKQEINAQVDRLADAFREERLSSEQFATIVEKLVESPLSLSILVAAADSQYFDQSGLSDEEKAAGRQSLRRFARGAIDGAIDEQSIDAALAHIADRQPDGQWRLREEVSDEQLRDFLDSAEREADEAGIAEIPEDFDPAEEFTRIIDEALNEP